MFGYFLVCNFVALCIDILFVEEENTFFQSIVHVVKEISYTTKTQL